MCTANQRRAKFVFKTHVYDVDDVNSQGMTSHSCVRCGRLESMHIRPHLFAAQNCAPATILNHTIEIQPHRPHGSDVTPQSGRGLHSPRHVFVHTVHMCLEQGSSLIVNQRHKGCHRSRQARESVELLQMTLIYINFLTWLSPAQLAHRAHMKSPGC